MPFKDKEAAAASKKEWRLRNPKKVVAYRKLQVANTKQNMIAIKEFAPDYFNKVRLQKLEEKARYNKLANTKLLRAARYAATES